MGLTLSDIIWPSPLFFLSFFIQLSQGQCSPTYFEPSPFFWFFCLDFKIKFSPTYFGAFPYFLQFFSVLMWLTISDIIWPPPFFFIILYRIITRSMFSDIFWPSPLFFIFCLEFKIEFSPTYFGAFSYFLRLMIWNFSSFLSFLSNYHKVNLLRHILTLPLYFLIFIV